MRNKIDVGVDRMMAKATERPKIRPRRVVARKHGRLRRLKEKMQSEEIRVLSPLPCDVDALMASVEADDFKNLPHPLRYVDEAVRRGGIPGLQFAASLAAQPRVGGFGRFPQVRELAEAMREIVCAHLKSRRTRKWSPGGGG